MHADSLSEDRGSPSCYAVGILVGVLFWLTGCAGLKGPQGQEGGAVDPFLQSGPVGTAPAQTAVKPVPKEAVASAAVPAPKTPATVTSAAVPAPKPGPTMTPGGAAAKLLPPETLSPGTATLVSGSTLAPSGEPQSPAALQTPLQQADWQSGSQSMTLEEANRRVQLLNPVSQRLERRNGKWKFVCELTKPNDPDALQLYEAEADKELDAVLAVLAKIEQDRSRP